MISAALPRFRSGFPRSALRRDWRLFALAGLLIALLVTGIVQGQIARGDRGITPINSSGDFLTSGIKIDVTAKNAEEARELGWREAQRKGWAQLYRKTNGSDGPALGDSVLDGIVTAIVVEKEEFGPRRYVATLGVQFDRVRAGQILGVSGRTLRSPPLLVIPVYSIAGIPQVFERRSEWQRAWAEYNTGQSAIDYVRTAGTGADTLLINAGQVGRRGRVWWRVILDQYGAADVLIPTARIEYSYPGGPITGHFAARFGPDDELLGTFTMTGPSTRALPDMMEKAVARMDRIYTDALAAGTLRTDRYLVLEKPVEVEDLPEETIGDDALAGEIDVSVLPPATPQPGVASFTVQYASPDVESVSATERAVGAVPGVQSASTTSLALGGTSVMRVSFRGDIAALKAALEARGYEVQQGGNTLRINR
ncbi:heavy-metal-associated domain-containing protein [Sphingopyxis indica]|uniref:heavy-metal-associated domain-containing protein n=1 Tax=Sphingopyxis indica TaxID=436663 RepID=UPI002939452F|nr:heavy-metal-associated domain-containing protein [Sphingopyxis indica]WOF41750.1 heavy-metal-associated domain-containing protein [Sphingopyxis indica]